MDPYHIPQHLDEPFKLILWTLDEFIVFLTPFIVFLLFLNSPLFGLCIGAGLLFGLKRIKGDQGHYFLYNLLYWYCPFFIFLKATPPSYQRTLLG
jgi:conjugal transfer pilus assembly protein TraL